MSSLQTDEFEFLDMLLHRFKGEGPFTDNSAKALAFFVLAHVNTHIKQGCYCSALSCILTLVLFLEKEHQANVDNAEWEMALERGGAQ